MSSKSSATLPLTNQVITWDQFQLDCLRLANKIVKRRKYDQCKTVLYCVPRGGLTPAAVLAYELKLSTVRTLSNLDGRSSLHDCDFIIDSLYDTGKTYYYWIEKFPHVNYAFVYAKHNLPPDKVLIGRRIDTRDYLVFPWEGNE